MSKPKNFMIYTPNLEAFQRTWNGLVALGYEVSCSAGEREYKGSGGVIKHNHGLGYIWASKLIDNTKTSYSSFEAFLSVNSLQLHPSQAPTMNDAIRAVELDRELVALQGEEEYKVGELNALRDRIAAKMNDLKAVQEKLGIKA